jgi:molybdopterin-guanine dinucleotide biosynthesis protein A
VRIAGLLLTGGASKRLGAPKATLLRDGERLVDRGMRLLGEVCDPVLEVGPGYGGLGAVQEDPPGAGPLAALAAGGAALRAEGHDGNVLVLAVDLPMIETTLLAWLATHPGPGAVVPRVEGMPQSLCARYDLDAFEAARRLVAAGERSMRALLTEIPVTYTDVDEWGEVADTRAFTDVDTPDAVARAGLQTPG